MSAPTKSPACHATTTFDAIARFREPATVGRHPATGAIEAVAGPALPAGFEPHGSLPPLYPEWLGDRGFLEAHGVRFAYVAGEMANGIATAEMVIAMARARMLGFFGSAGLPLARVDEAIVTIQAALGPNAAWGLNLIHSPQEPHQEDALVDLAIARGVTRLSASAFMALTPAVVRYAARGLHLDAEGRVQRRHHVFAKISRPETARQFMAPAPAAMLDALVAQGALTAQEAALAARVALAEDITVESDSGGHTDNRPLGSLFPTIMTLRDEVATAHRLERPVRIGAAGGLATPSSVAAAFAMGAAYVITGSINQSAVESGLCEAGRELLAKADVADVVMAPAGDMFELGVKVQVLKRGTMFAPRAQQLYDLYMRHDSLEALPAETRARLEADVFKQPIAQVWEACRRYFAERDARQLTLAEADPRHRMALVFRWYLGQSSRWAIRGLGDRRMDYQIWCGPAMGAFNAWVKGSFLEPIASRTVVQIALNLLEGAAAVTRAQQLRSYGVAVPAAAFSFSPRPLQ